MLRAVANSALSVTASNITGVVSPVNGGTGIANNAASTLTISGAFPTSLTVSASTALTLPTSGTVFVLENTQAVTGAISFTNAATKVLVTNSNANAQFTIEQTSTGDSSLQFLLTGVRAWGVGVDNSDSDKFKISAANDGFTTPIFTIDVNKNVFISVVAGGTNAVGVLGIGTGTAPTTAPADMIQIYSSDVSAGNCALSWFQEMAPYAGVAVASTTKVPVIVNGTVYYMLATTVA